jgi:hypothetical protein
MNPDFYEKSLSPVGGLLVFSQLLAPLSHVFAVLLFFMGDFVFLIFIMAQPHGQMLSM